MWEWLQEPVSWPVLFMALFVAALGGMRLGHWLHKKLRGEN
jgi:uncharacterized membrane protein YfcA